MKNIKLYLTIILLLSLECLAYGQCTNRQEIIEVPQGNGGGWFGSVIDTYGSSFIIGSYGDDEMAQNSGAAYLYQGTEGNRTVTKLLPSDGTTSSRFGWSVALHQQTAVVGSPDRKAVYKYTKVGGSWVEEKIQPSTLSQNINFGNSIDIEGNIIIVGDYGVDGAGYNYSSGRVYIYENGIETILSPPMDESYLQFGYKVAIDGGKILVGAPGKILNGDKNGAAYLYSKLNGVWTLEQEFLSPTPRDRSRFGLDLCLKGDRAAIAEPGLSNSHGIVYVFDKSGNAWGSASIIPSNSTTGDQFGYGIEISTDEIIVSASRNNNGQVYKYAYDGSTWSEEILPIPPWNPSEFGGAVAYLGDSYILGAWRELSSVGRAYIYHCDKPNPCSPDHDILWDFYQSTGGPSWTNITTSTQMVGAVNVPYMLAWWENLYYQFGFTNWVDISSIIEFQPLFTDIDFVNLIDFYQSNPTLIDAGTPTAVTDAWFADCDPCGIQDGSPWKGITCNSIGEITHINLHSSGLVGTLPSSLSGLTSMQSLNLGNNQLSGSIPSTYASLINLQIWNMESNGFSGQFPSFLVDFDYLQYLHLGNNDLSGSLPLDFSNLTYLKEFRVNDNQLSGSLTNTFGSCTQLIHFDASSNSLNNNLPSSFGGLADLTHIYLDENQFTGEIPGQWGDLQSIIRIDVSQNQLTGTLLDNNLEKLCPINTITNYHINDGNNIDELWSMMCHCVSTDYPTFSMYPAFVQGQADPNMPCCQIFTDDVIQDGDGNVYTAYRIGNQVWLQENLMTTSCLDGTALPNYRRNGNDHNTTGGIVWYGDNTCVTPLVTNASNLSGGFAPGLVIPYGRYYSHYIFSQGSTAFITGNYTQYSDGAICQVCPEGFRIANAADFYYLKQFIGSKDIYDVTETCFNPLGAGFINTTHTPQQYTHASGYTYTAAWASAQSRAYIWVSSNNLTSITTLPMDIHIFPNTGIELGSGTNAVHLQPRNAYRTLRCIKQ